MYVSNVEYHVTFLAVVLARSFFFCSSLFTELDRDQEETFFCILFLNLCAVLCCKWKSKKKTKVMEEGRKEGK